MEQALHELVAQHPELELGPLEDPFVADPELTRLLIPGNQAEIRRQRQWWNWPDTRRPHSHVELGEEVARYGRFRVHVGNLRLPTGGVSREGWYEFRLDQGSSDAPEGRLVWAGQAGIPVTPTAYRATVLAHVQQWLDGLREDIALGRQALDEMQGADVAARIRAGLQERERQYQMVEHALREVESEDEGKGQAPPE